MKKLLLITLPLLFILSTGFMSINQDGWNIPDKYKKMNNPHKNDKSTLSSGKILYSKYCKSCHGVKGDWDGPMAKRSSVPSEKFSTNKFKSQSDGEIYYKSFVGNDNMPNFEKKIQDEKDRWAIVNYMKTL